MMSPVEIQARIREVLERGYLMSLGTMDEGGVWVCDVIYVFDDDFNLYWMSDPAVRHSKALQKHEKLAGTVTVSGKGEDNFGIQFEGLAQKIDGSRHDLARKHFAKRGKPEPAETEDVLEGDSWYVLRPTKIELIDEKNFGFDKQVLRV